MSNFTLAQIAENYVAGHNLIRVTLATVGGKVNITPPDGQEFVSLMFTVKRKAGDTTGKYCHCMADDFSFTAGGDILVYNIDGTDAPDDTEVIAFCETKSAT